jgi:hypothetical protein
MSQIVLIKTQNSALDNNDPAKQDLDTSDRIRLNGKVAEIRLNGTLVFATESLGSLVMANPGNLNLGDNITIELHKDNIAAAGRLVAINNVSINTQENQTDLSSITTTKSHQEILDVVNVHLDTQVIAQTTGRIVKLYNQGAAELKSLENLQVKQHLGLEIMRLNAFNNFDEPLVTIESILSDDINLKNTKLQLMQKFINANFAADDFFQSIKNDAALLRHSMIDQVMPARVLEQSGQKLLLTPVGQISLDHSSDIDDGVEMVLVKLLPNSSKFATDTEDLSIQGTLKSLSEILSSMQAIKEQKGLADNYLEEIFQFLGTVSKVSTTRTKAGLSFLGLINIEFVEDESIDLESDLQQDGFKPLMKRSKIQDLQDLINFFKDNPQDDSLLKPALIKDEIWIPILLHLNGEIIDEDQAKCYVKKSQSGILRFFIDITFAKLQLDGMIKLSQSSRDVEEFSLIVHAPKSDNQMSGDIKDIFYQNLQKHKIRGNVTFDNNLAQVISINTEPFDQIIA